MKKLLSIVLCFAIIASLTPVVFASNDGYKEVMSNKVWSFSEETDVSKYGSAGNVTTTSTVTLAPDSGISGAGDTALKLTRANDKPSNVNFSMVSHTEKLVYAEEFETKFKFKVDTKDTLFKFTFRNEEKNADGKSSGDYNVLECGGGNVRFFGTKVSNYDANTWYHVEMKFNIPKSYGVLKIKADGEDAFKTFPVFAHDVVVYSYKDTSNNNKTITFSHWNHTMRLAVGLQNANGVAFIDDYYQNYADVDVELLKSDDFSNGINAWTPTNVVTQNTDIVSATAYDMGGNSVLKIESDTTGSANRSANTNMAQSFSDDVTAKYAGENYYFRYKFGGDTRHGAIGASLQTAGGTDAYKELFIVKIFQNNIGFFGEIAANNSFKNINSSFGGFDSSKLYDVEAVYNSSNGHLTAVITNDKGVQFIQTYTAGAISGAPKRFAFRNNVATSSTSVAYFDDFESKLMDSDGPQLINSEILSGYKDAANLDETVVFTYDRTINQQALADAVVTLNDEVLTSDKYTITSNGEKVLITFNKLNKDTNYTLKLQNVKDIISNSNNKVAEISFKTANGDFAIENLDLSDNGVLSVNSANYYAESKPVVLILAIYNKELTMLKNVQAVTFTADSRNKVLSYDFSKLLENKESDDVIKGFVWTDINTKTPYLENIIK